MYVRLSLHDFLNYIFSYFFKVMTENMNLQKKMLEMEKVQLVRNTFWFADPIIVIVLTFYKGTRFTTVLKIWPLTILHLLNSVDKCSN